MKDIYVKAGIKIYVYSENEFDKVAESFCVYGECRAVMGIKEVTASANTLILLSSYCVQIYTFRRRPTY